MSDSVLLLTRKSIRFAQRYGFVRTIYFLIHGAISRFGLEKRIRFCVTDILFSKVSDLPKGCRLPKAFRLALATDRDVPAIESLGRKAQHVKARLSEGDQCLLLWLGSELNAVEWIALGPRGYWEDWNEMRTVIGVPPGCCWAYDGKGVAPGAWGLIMRVLPKELEANNIRTIYLRVDYANPVSLSSHLSAGYSPVARIFHFGVGSFCFSRCRDKQGHWLPLPAKVGDLELTVPSTDKVSHQFKLFPMYRNW